MVLEALNNEASPISLKQRRPRTLQRADDISEANLEFFGEGEVNQMTSEDPEDEVSIRAAYGWDQLSNSLIFTLDGYIYWDSDNDLPPDVGHHFRPLSQEVAA